MKLDINEPVGVIVSFGGVEKVRPIKFRWRGRTIDVQDVTYRWKIRKGNLYLYCFSVYDGSTLYELVFDSLSLRWTLKALEVE